MKYLFLTVLYGRDKTGLWRMLYLYNKNVFFIERRGMEERKEMVNEIQSDSWNRGKRQSGRKAKTI